MVKLKLSLRARSLAPSTVSHPDHLPQIARNHVTPPGLLLWSYTHGNDGLRTLDAAPLPLLP